MDKIKVHIGYKDPEYSFALENALILESEKFIISDDNDALIVDESLIPLYEPVPDIIKKIMAMTSIKTEPAQLIDNVTFTAFCSAVGGSGKTCCAYNYACLLSRVYNRRVSFLSLDPSYRNTFKATTDYGIEFLTELPEKTDSDEIVLDLCFNTHNYGDLLDSCENRIVVMGFDENRFEAGECFYQLLKYSGDSYINPPKTLKLYNHYQENINDIDIHSQLGKDLFNLKKEIEGAYA